MLFRLIFLGLLIYASVLYHRHRRSKLHKTTRTDEEVDIERSPRPRSSTGPKQYWTSELDAQNAGNAELHPGSAMQTHPIYPHFADRNADGAVLSPNSTVAPPYEYAEMSAKAGGSIKRGDVKRGDMGGSRRSRKELEGDSAVHELPAVRSMKSLPRLPRKAVGNGSVRSDAGDP